LSETPLKTTTPPIGAASGDSPLVEEGTIFRIFCTCGDSAFCEALADGLRSEGDFDLCCKSNTGSEAIEEAIDLYPDLVILEKEKPQIGDFQVSEALKLYMPDVPLFLVTQLEGMLAEKEALSHGIDAVFAKDHDFTSLLENACAVCGLTPKIS
jgi:CheY-like chemotaxis protein